MQRVVIVVNSEVKATSKLAITSPVTEKMVAALSQAIVTSCPTAAVEVIAAGALWSGANELSDRHTETIYCPLTIQLPDWFKFPARDIYKNCRDIEARRQWVERKLAYKTSTKDTWLGNLWLPIIFTGKKPLYGEIIEEGAIPNTYEQPLHISDRTRRSLQYLAYQLLESIDATPAVYLLQFRLLSGEVIFDRLWPFPAAPAIASIGCQKPDLFACHWQCLLGQPVTNLTIASPL
jgi:hypothetical protein